VYVIGSCSLGKHRFERRERLRVYSDTLITAEWWPITLTVRSPGLYFLFSSLFSCLQSSSELPFFSFFSFNYPSNSSFGRLTRPTTMASGHNVSVISNSTGENPNLSRILSYCMPSTALMHTTSKMAKKSVSRQQGHRPCHS
jgi:hypothetical protein